MTEPIVLVSRAGEVPESPARREPASRLPLRVGLVQHRWHEDRRAHVAAISEGVRIAAAEGARLVCLQELTLQPYFAIDPGGPPVRGVEPERVDGGPTYELAAALAAETAATVHASLYERADDGGLGFNTAICVAPDGALLARTRKLHLPVTSGYHEDRWFRQGDTGYPVVALLGTRVGFPTCWDEWFPEVARAYALRGAEIAVYPSAIGSEPDLPAFDTQPIWEQVIRGHGIANGLFMVVPNRIGREGAVTFYGSSFVSDPYGRVLARAPRDLPAVLVADLDLDQRRDWLDRFPLLRTRRPDTYGPLTEVAPPAR
jgi:N-carbamoylputrescine amidase